MYVWLTLMWLALLCRLTVYLWQWCDAFHYPHHTIPPQTLHKLSTILPQTLQVEGLWKDGGGFVEGWCHPSTNPPPSFHKPSTILPQTLHHPSTNPPPSFHKPSTTIPLLPSFHKPSTIPPLSHRHPSTVMPPSLPPTDGLINVGGTRPVSMTYWKWRIQMRMGTRMKPYMPPMPCSTPTEKSKGLPLFTNTSLHAYILTKEQWNSNSIY